MADNLLMKDCSIRTVLNTDDFLDLTEEFMGVDAERWLAQKISAAEEAVGYAQSLENELTSLETCRDRMLRKLQELSWTLSNIACQKDIDSEELTGVAGEIAAAVREGHNNP